MYLGLDLGTSGLKALLIDDDQTIIAHETASLTVSRPQTGWSEQEPSDWIAACRVLFSKLRSYLPHVKAIGLAGHMHGLVLLDDNDVVLRPCILWNDVRAMTQAQSLDAISAFRQISGTIVFPGFSAPKMQWVRDHEPAVWSRAKTMLFPKDFLGFWLTGKKHCEPSDASGSALFDCATGEWSKILCDHAGIDPALLAPLMSSDGKRGTITAQIATEFGLSKDVVVAGGAGDNAAAATGIGAVSKGHGLVSLGTSGVVLTVNDKWTPQAETAVHSFCHAATSHFIQMGVTLTATDSLSWLSDIMERSPAELSNILPTSPTGPGEMIYLPYLAGERTPHNSDKALGAFIGLNRHDGRAELTQAVMEGVAYSLADCLRALQDAGADLEVVTAVGGGAKSHYWLQLISNVLDRPLAINHNAEHAAALGAARLGMAACKACAIQQLIAPETSDHIIYPDPNITPSYQKKQQYYRNLYQAIRGAGEI